MESGDGSKELPAEGFSMPMAMFKERMRELMRLDEASSVAGAVSEEKPPLPIREPSPPIIAHQDWEHLWRRSLALPGTHFRRCACGETRDGWDD